MNARELVYFKALFSLSYFLVSESLNCMVHREVNPFHPKGFPVDEENHLALDRVKSISAILASCLFC